MVQKSIVLRGRLVVVRSANYRFVRGANNDIAIAHRQVTTIAVQKGATLRSF